MFNAGDRVILADRTEISTQPITRDNPDVDVQGTIRYVGGEFEWNTRVEWDNGGHNVYKWANLSLVSSVSEEPKVRFGSWIRTMEKGEVS